MAAVTAQNGYALKWGPNGEAAPELSGGRVDVNLAGSAELTPMAQTASTVGLSVCLP